MSSSKERQDFVAHAEAMQVEAAGVWSIYIFYKRNMPQLLAEALAGDELSANMLKSVADMITHIKAPRRKPTLCLCCPRAIRSEDRFSVCVLVPHRDDPSRGLSSAICEKCNSVDERTFAESILTAARKLIPDARMIKPMAEAGHA